MFPAGIYLAALETYDTPKEMEEHIFEGSLIEQDERCVLDASTFYVVLNVLCVQMHLSTVEPCRVAVVFKYVLLIGGVADFRYLVIRQNRYALALVLYGVALLNINGLLLVLLVEATAIIVRDFSPVLVSVCDTFAIQNSCYLLIMEV